MFRFSTDISFELIILIYDLTNSVQVESLYPGEMGPHLMDTEDFLGSGLASLNVIISERVKTALSKGNVLRYVCMIEDSRFIFPPILILSI